MNNSFPAPISDQKSAGLGSLPRRDSPAAREIPGEALRGKWLPVMLLGVYFFSLWAPSEWPVPDLRWYMAVGLAIPAFFLQNTPLSAKGTRLFWIVYGLSLYGALFSLLRAPNVDLALWNTVAFAVSFVTYMLFLPVLATRLARKVLLGILIGIALLWTFEIQNLVRTYGTLAYSTFGLTGDDKNSIGFVLTLAGIALFYLAVFWKPMKPMPKSPLFLLRLVLGLAGLYFFYNMFLIYARSALLLALTGMGVILVVLFIKSQGKSRFLRVALIAAALILAGFLALPKVLTISPRWIDMAANVQMSGVDAFPHRVILIQKGIFLISQNPFLGVGIGGSKASVSSSSYFFPGFWIHNMYLTDWAEKGVLGLLSYVVWILAYLKIVRTEFLDLPLIDQVWLVLLMLLFLEMLFLDINTVSYIMLGILTGIYYEQYLVEQANKTRSNPGA